jgi:adenosylcobyric acid synthase
MRDRGWDEFLAAHCAAGGVVVGICGGYQMMGRRIADPSHVESDLDEVAGLGLLDIETHFEGTKITTQVQGTHLRSGLPISGYEIHSGRIARFGNKPLLAVGTQEQREFSEPEGAITDNRRILGTSIHGLFDAPRFRRQFLNDVRRRKGLAPLSVMGTDSAHVVRSKAYDRFARLLSEHLDLGVIAHLVNIEPERLYHYDVPDRDNSSRGRE